eukprot:6207874-Pleurochrysis_carterae.AAC.2
MQARVWPASFGLIVALRTEAREGGIFAVPVLKRNDEDFEKPRSALTSLRIILTAGRVRTIGLGGSVREAGGRVGHGLRAHSSSSRSTT